MSVMSVSVQLSLLNQQHWAQKVCCARLWFHCWVCLSDVWLACSCSTTGKVFFFFFAGSFSTWIHPPTSDLRPQPLSHSISNPSIRLFIFGASRWANPSFVWTGVKMLCVLMLNTTKNKLLSFLLAVANSKMSRSVHKAEAARLTLKLKHVSVCVWLRLYSPVQPHWTHASYDQI